MIYHIGMQFQLDSVVQSFPREFLEELAVGWEAKSNGLRTSTYGVIVTEMKVSIIATKYIGILRTWKRTKRNLEAHGTARSKYSSSEKRTIAMIERLPSRILFDERDFRLVAWKQGAHRV
jgi:hypothetical protein